jgi:polysaccharide pyruvyl transferase WcaK-like protein
VGLLWHSIQSGNLGVGALTVANMALARKAAQDVGLEPTFVILGMRDDHSETYDGVEDTERFGLDFARLLSPAGCWSRFGELDCLLDIGAGDSFADIYGATRFFFLWWTKVLALAQRKPLLLSPQTIGPFTRTPYRQLARLTLERTSAVVTRDPESLAALHAMAGRVKGLLAVDVAFALPYEDQSRLRGGRLLRVGVNVSGLLHHEARSGRNRFGLQADYAVAMTSVVDELVGRDDVEVHLISHVRGNARDPDDDEQVARELARQIPGVVLAPRFESPGEAKSYISGLDFLIAARMHACIAAFSAGVPVVPVAYSRKFSGLFGMLEYPWIVPVRGLDTAESSRRILDCLDRREELAADVAKGRAKADALLEVYCAELRRFFSEVAG